MVRIRHARPDELDAVAELMVRAYEQYADMMPSYAWEEYARDIRDVRSRLPVSELLVAEHDGEVLGAVTFYPDASRTSYAEPDGQVVGGWPKGWTAVRLLATHPKARGLGVGRLLMEDTLRRSRALGATAMGLHTTELMEVARSMYERMGFRRATQFDYHPMPDFVVMAYRLDLSGPSSGASD